MMRYPVKLTKDGDAIAVSFVGLPVHTFGCDEEDALVHAVDALETLFMGVMASRQPIPNPPSVPKKFKGKWVALPALSEAKIELYRTMLEEKIGKAELARRLNAHLPQIDRLLDLSHASRLDQIEQALLAVGKRLKIVVEDAA
jgi:antitoxin HicB